MKNKVQSLLVWVFFLFLSGLGHAQHSEAFNAYRQEYDQQMAELLGRQFQEVSAWFEDAYRSFPTLPKGVLEAVAFQYTRFSPNVIMDTLELDPSEIPRVYSVMGLTLHGKGVFRENARLLAFRTPYSIDAILWQPGVAVRAYAHAFAQLQQEYRCFGDSLEQYKPIFIDLCELPIPEEGDDDFAMNSFLYMIYEFLHNEEYVPYGSPGRQVDYNLLFGAELNRLRSGRTEVSPAAGARSSMTVPDYPNALFVPAATCNYTSGRGGTVVSSVTIHYTQGTYAGSIAWFQNCSAKASAHYVIRSVDGQVTQMVGEADKAWHVGVANSYTIGIEHEAYGNIYSFFTMNMYQSSANLVKNICSRRSNISPHRVFYRDTLDDGTVLNSGVHSLGGATACTKIRGHQHYPSQTHTDPGNYWDWNLYYKLINDTSSVTVFSGETGAFTDSGGLWGNYGDDERKLYHIYVAGVDSIALTFQDFNLEPDYDFMWIYEGGSEFSPLLGRWNTQSPGRVVAAGEHMMVEFRSDCATGAAGWNAQWQAVTGTPGGTGGGGGDEGDEEDDDAWISWEPDENEPQNDNAVPQTVINTDAAQWITHDFTATFTDTDDSGLKWRFYQIMESDGVSWRARPEKGFLCDNFDNQLDNEIWLNDQISPWEVQNGALRQNNALVSYAAVAAHHNGAAHRAYLYDFYLNFISGEKCSFFFNCNLSPSQTSPFSGYEVCFDRINHTVSVYRLIVGAKRLLKTNTQVYFQTGTSYFCRIVFDSSTGEIVVLRHANRIVRAVDEVLTTTSDSYIGFVARFASISIDNLRVYGSRNTSVPLSVGPDSACDIRQPSVNGLIRTKLKSIVMDRAYKLSALAEKSLKVDYTPPPAVENLTLQMESFTQTDGTPLAYVSASWNPTTDAQSGIRRYYYHNSSMANASLSNLWMDNGTFLSCYHCYTVNPSEMIVFGVVAENNAGICSAPNQKKVFLIPDGVLSDRLREVKWLLSNHRSLQIRYSPLSEKETFPELTLGYALYDMTGKRMMQGVFQSYTDVDVSGLRQGVYLLRVIRGSDVLLTNKVVILP